MENLISKALKWWYQIINMPTDEEMQEMRKKLKKTNDKIISEEFRDINIPFRENIKIRRAKRI